MHEVTLACHPDTAAGAVRRVRVRVARVPGGVLVVRYLIEGEVDRLRVPASRLPRVADGLWRHTCCEAFVARGLPAYHEFNFSPSGEWAVAAFEGHRRSAPPGAAPDAEKLDPEITVRVEAGKLELDATIHLDRLSPSHARARLSLALAAVIESREGALSYWALKHPPGQPDFHHADAFALVVGG